MIITIIITLVIFFTILSLLVFVHEAGHFIMARRAGMGVHEFGFGFPPRVVGIQKQNGKWRVVWGKKKVDPGHTVYSINAFPLGGFVKIMGEDGEETEMGDGGWIKGKDGKVDGSQKSFTHKSFWARFSVLFAGVAMNVITAWVILSVGFMIGLPIAVNALDEVPQNAKFSNQQILIGQVKDESPAAKAGLKDSDIITSVDGQKITDITQLQDYIKAHQGQKMNFVVQRINETITAEVDTSTVTDPSKGIVGIGLAYYGKIKFGPVQAIWHGAQTTVNQLQAIANGIIKIFSTKEGVKGVGGPIKIAQLTGQVADLGILPLLQFTAFLSLNLAILNTLPFPALDGGRMLFLIIEKLRGKPNKQSIEQYANAIGFVLLLLLMAVITVRDVSQLQVIKNLF